MSDSERPDLSSLLEECRVRLTKGSVEPDNPFHFPVISTVSDSQLPECRIVVLRFFNWEKRSFAFYTDSRSRKVSSLMRTPHAEALFYDPARRLQIRIRARMQFLKDVEKRRRHWENLSDKQRKDYRALAAPGTPIELPPEPSPEDRNDPMWGFDHFAVVAGQFDAIDVVLLRDEAHLHAVYRMVYDEWESTWLIP